MFYSYKGQSPREHLHNPQMRNHYGFHLRIQFTGPLPHSSSAPQYENVFFHSEPVFFPGSVLETFPHFHNLDKYKAHKMSVTQVAFSVQLISLRMFSMFMNIVTHTSTSFIFCIMIKSIKHNIYHLNHLKQLVLWHSLHLHCCTNILTIQFLYFFKIFSK